MNSLGGGTRDNIGNHKRGDVVTEKDGDRWRILHVISADEDTYSYRVEGLCSSRPMAEAAASYLRDYFKHKRLRNIHQQIAILLCWTEEEVQSFSLPALRELVRAHKGLSSEITDWINNPGRYYKDEPA